MTFSPHQNAIPEVFYLVSYNGQWSVDSNFPIAISWFHELMANAWKTKPGLIFSTENINEMDLVCLCLNFLYTNHQ